MTMSETRRVLDLLRIDVPIVQAPMAGVASPAMAAAVANAGGLGSIGVGASDAAGARAMIDAVRAATRRSLNVNVFCHRPERPDAEIDTAWLKRLRPEFERLGAAPPAALKPIFKSFLEDGDMLALLLEARPRIVSCQFGMPRPDQIQALRRAGIVILGTATSVAEAKAAAAAGADAVVAQGYEAGGHRGVFDPDVPDDRLGTLALTRLLVRSLGVPVIAAGGIMDGAGIAAALRLGAAAAQLGTAFVGTDESLADSGYRAGLKSDAAHHTVVTAVLSGRPARCLPNRVTAFGAGIDAAHIPSYPLAYAAAKALGAAGKAAGEPGFGAHWAGQGAPLTRFISTGALMAALIAEMTDATLASHS